jgi:hypothetical protein
VWPISLPFADRLKADGWTNIGGGSHDCFVNESQPEKSAGESAVMNPLLIDSGRTVRANVSFDAALLDAIDAAAKERGLTRSAFLSSAARGKIMAGA